MQPGVGFRPSLPLLILVDEYVLAYIPPGHPVRRIIPHLSHLARTPLRIWQASRRNRLGSEAATALVRECFHRLLNQALWPERKLLQHVVAALPRSSQQPTVVSPPRPQSRSGPKPQSPRGPPRRLPLIASRTAMTTGGWLVGYSQRALRSGVGESRAPQHASGILVLCTKLLLRPSGNAFACRAQERLLVLRSTGSQ